MANNVPAFEKIKREKKQTTICLHVRAELRIPSMKLHKGKRMTMFYLNCYGLLSAFGAPLFFYSRMATFVHLESINFTNCTLMTSHTDICVIHLAAKSNCWPDSVEKAALSGPSPIPVHRAPYTAAGTISECLSFHQDKVNKWSCALSKWPAQTLSWSYSNGDSVRWSCRHKISILWGQQSGNA